MRSPKSPRLVTIAIISTATIIFWIFFEVYRIFTTASPVNVPSELLQPINPVLDNSALQNIEGRVFFEEEEIPETPVGIPEIIIESTPTEFPEETPIEEVSPTPTATESASF
jgi:hypothetical protein